MNKLTAALAALRHGAILADPTTWKRRQNLMNALLGLIGAAAVFLPVEVSDADATAIAGGIAAIAGLLNAYLTTSTTDKLGLPARPAPADRPADGADGSGPYDTRIEP